VIAYCPTCRQDAVLNDAGRCSWCDTPSHADVADKPRRGGGGPGARWLTEPQLRAAHRAHVDGESLNSIGKRLLVETRYTSLYGVVAALSGEWKRRGWFVRDRIEACVAASTIHGRARRGANRDPEYKRECRRRTGKLLDRPQCAALTIHGRPCRRRALATGPLCWNHAHPEQSRETADAMRARRPLRRRVWIVKARRCDELRAEGLTWREIADQLGYASAASAHSMARQARRIDQRRAAA
jgi:hypothetical protein